MGNKALTAISKLLSFAFHPLFLVPYGLVFLLVVNPYLFGASQVMDRKMLIILVFISSTLIPTIAIILMRLLGMIDSIQIGDKQDRTGPFIITAILYLWLFINLKNQSEIPVAFNICMLGSIITLFFCFFINIFEKVSVHAAGMGAMIAFAIIVRLRFSYGVFIIDLPIIGAFKSHLNQIIPLMMILAGAVISSRLQLKAHTMKQVVIGFGVGFLGQIIAWKFLL